MSISGGGGGVLVPRGGGGGYGGGRLPPRRGGMPGAIGRGVAGTLGTVAAYGAANWIYDQFGNPVRKKRRRARGVSARDIQGFNRVSRLADKYTATSARRKTKRACK